MYTTSFSHNEVLTLSSAPQSAPEYIQLFGLQYCLFDLLSRLDKHGSTRVKLYIENEGKGKENWFAVAGGSSYQELTVNVSQKSRENQFWFEISEGSSYQE